MSAEAKRVTKTEVWVGWENQVIGGGWFIEARIRGGGVVGRFFDAACRFDKSTG